MIHKKIILKFGTLFLLVTLKIHVITARSITDEETLIISTDSLKTYDEVSIQTSTPLTQNDTNLRAPDYLHRNLNSEFQKSKDNTDSNIFQGWNFTSPISAENAASENFQTENSKTDGDKVLIHNSSLTSFKNDSANYHTVISGHQDLSDTQTLMPNNNNRDNFSLIHTDDGLTNFSKNLNVTTETTQISHLVDPKNINSSITKHDDEKVIEFETGKIIIENFGKDIQKLKKNVHNFQDSLRKILLDKEQSPVIDIVASEHQMVPTSSVDGGIFLDNQRSDTRTNNDFTSVKPEKAGIYSEGRVINNGDAVGVTTIRYDSENVTARHSLNVRHSVDYSKISAVVSNVSEVSRRVGAFIKKQYLDINSNDEKQNRNEMYQRDLDNLVEDEEIPTSQVLQQWVQLEESFRESVDAVVRQALPLLVRASSEMQLSNPCYTSFFQLLLGLRRLRPWAFQMIDAFAKPPAGMLQGTVTSFGAYDECVNIVAMSDAKKRHPAQRYFQGKYCTIEIKPPLPPKPQYYTMYKPVSILANFSSGDDNVIRQAARQAHAFYFLTYRMDICVPSTCSQDDVNNMAQFAAKYIDIEVAVPRCSVKEKLEFNKIQVIVICITGGLLSFVMFGTAIDTLWEIFYRAKIVAKCVKNGFTKFLLSFSLNTNANILLHTDAAENGLDPVHGMRFFGMGWLVLGHTYFNSNVQMYGNLTEASGFAEGFFFQIIVNSTVSIDTFFFISAVLLSYVTLQSTSKDGNFSIPKVFLRRITRIIPPYMMVIGATFLLPHLGSGPFWNETVDPVVENCERNWWTNILFLNNFLTTPTQRCLEHSWYISCEFQLFVFALFILLAMIKRPVYGIILNLLMILISMVMTGLLTYYYQVPPTLLASFPDPEERKFLNQVILSKPICHLGPYCVGLGTGYFFYRCKQIKLKAYHHVIGWGSAISVTAAVVYGVLEWNKGNLPTTAAALAYAATHRTAWTLGLSWITVVCVAGYGGPINRILSWKVFIPLSRLTYMVYLIHPLIQYILTGYIRERLQTNHIILAYFFFGHIMTSYALSAACFFLFDGPVEALMRLVLGNCTAPVPALAKISAIKKAADEFPNVKLRNSKQ